jgi:hypothetical protein
MKNLLKISLLITKFSIPQKYMLRESTFIMAGGGGGGEDVMKKAHYFTVPLLKLLVNFQCPPKKIGIELIKEYNPEFSLIIDTICSSSRCLIYSGTRFSSEHKYRLAASFTSLSPDEMAPSLKNILDWF